MTKKNHEILHKCLLMEFNSSLANIQHNGVLSHTLPRETCRKLVHMQEMEIRLESVISNLFIHVFVFHSRRVKMANLHPFLLERLVFNSFAKMISWTYTLYTYKIYKDDPLFNKKQ